MYIQSAHRKLSIAVLLFCFFPHITLSAHAEPAADADALDMHVPNSVVAETIKNDLIRYREAVQNCARADIFSKAGKNFALAIVGSPPQKSKIAFAENFNSYRVDRRSCASLRRSFGFKELRILRSDENLYKVIALIERKSDLFSSASIDTFRFDRSAQGFRLSQHLITPLKSQKNNGPLVQILIVDPGRYAALTNSINSVAGDDLEILLAGLKVGSANAIPVGGTRTVVAIFRDPLFAGDRIAIRHRYFNSQGRQTSQFDQGLSVKSTNLQFFFATTSSITFPGSARFEVFKNGRLLSARTIPTP